jgi:hypothetical protein
MVTRSPISYCSSFVRFINRPGRSRSSSFVLVVRWVDTAVNEALVG